MKTHNGCTYWYEISMHLDKNGNGYHRPAKIRIPVRCEISGEYASRCTYLNPSSASVETNDILNQYLFDSPISYDMLHNFAIKMRDDGAEIFNDETLLLYIKKNV